MIKIIVTNTRDLNLSSFLLYKFVREVRKNYFDMYVSYRWLFSCDLEISRAVPHFSRRHTGAIDRHMRYVITCVGARVVGWGVGKQSTKAIRCGPCYYSIVVNAHRVTSMANTDIDAVRKQKKAEVYTYSCYAYHFYAYRLYFINVWHVYEWPKTIYMIRYFHP
jgi:hypothetical protein